MTAAAAAAASAAERIAGGHKQVQIAGIPLNALESSAAIKEIGAQAALKSTAADGAAMGAMQCALERE